MTEDVRLVLGDVEKRYSNSDFHLGPISLVLEAGVTALLGANGAGKSTLIRICARLERPDAGSISDFGSAVRTRPGYLQQDFSAPPRATVRDYLAYVAWCRSTKENKISVSHCSASLERVGLADRAAHRVASLSGGMVRRLGIAQALVGGGKVLLMDEPTVGLDPIQRKEIRKLLVELGDDHSVVVSTHLSEDVAAIANRVLVLNAGSILFDGTPEDLAAVSGQSRVSSEAIEAGYMRLVESM